MSPRYTPLLEGRILIFLHSVESLPSSELHGIIAPVAAGTLGGCR